MTGEIDFSRWAVVSYNDDTGLGRMAQDARSVLGLGHQIVVPSARLETKPLRDDDLLLRSGIEDEQLVSYLSRLDGLITLEKPNWSERLLPLARQMGLPVVAVPMWEWFNVRDPFWRDCDAFFCPNEQCARVVRHYGFRKVLNMTWPLDLARLPRRRIAGPARLYIHNAGLVDRDDRKGTREVIAAFKRIRNPALRLKIRLQQPAELPELDERIRVQVGNEQEVSSLWEEGEVAVQPSKLEGIGFMVLEPVCAGLPVISLDVPPINEYGAGFLVKPRWFSRRGFASRWNAHTRLRLPHLGRLTAQMEKCARIDLTEASLRQSSWASEKFDRQKVRAEWEQALGRVASRRDLVS